MTSNEKMKMLKQEKLQIVFILCAYKKKMIITLYIIKTNVTSVLASLIQHQLGSRIQTDLQRIGRGNNKNIR